MGTTLHSRADWDARARRSVPGRISSDGVTVHYGGDSPWPVSVDRSSGAAFERSTVHESCATKVRGWQNYHMDGHGWSDIAYNSVVCPHGHRYDGRGPGNRSAANGTVRGNDRSEAVCYLAGGNDPVTDSAKRAFHDEAARFGRPLLWNHSDWKSTACAGPSVKAWQSQGWPRPFLPLTGDDFLSALTDQEQRDMKQQVGELYLYMVGPDVPAWGDGNPRHNSVYTRLKYLFGETLGGDNLEQFRGLLDTAVSNAETIDALLEAVNALEEELRSLHPGPAPVPPVPE